MDKTANILLCGVGGQGILLASEVMSSACLKAGYDVKQSEVHGMAQRGGSVLSHIRFGRKVYSPLIEPGSADIVGSFEMLEAMRYLPYMNTSTKVVVNTQKILPAPVATGIDVYPNDVLAQLAQRRLAVYPLDAFEIANSLGEARAVNMVLVGAISVFLPLETEVFLRVIRERISEKIRRVNEQAFLKGRETVDVLQRKTEAVRSY
jgi:indolepyruvate ferredoxin oxidoreductase beta subunit